MAGRNSNKREGATGVKAFIAAAAIAATVAGWALLPANDPPTVAADSGSDKAAIVVPAPGITAQNAAPETAIATPTPQTTTQGRRPFTRTRSSR